MRRGTMSRRTGAIPKAVLDDIVHRMVGVAKPEQIILFGPAARGEMGPNSDIDLLVIKSGDYDPRRLTEQIYRRLPGAKAAADVIVVMPKEVMRYKTVLSCHLSGSEGGRGCPPARGGADDLLLARTQG